MTNEKVEEHSNGRMEECTKESGRMVNSMELVYLRLKMDRLSVESG
jgi:hypothetical protein